MTLFTHASGLGERPSVHFESCHKIPSTKMPGKKERKNMLHYPPPVDGPPAAKGLRNLVCRGSVRPHEAPRRRLLPQPSRPHRSQQESSSR